MELTDGKGGKNDEVKLDCTKVENIESNESKLLDGNSIEEVPESIPEIIPNQIPELPIDDGN